MTRKMKDLKLLTYWWRRTRRYSPLVCILHDVLWTTAEFTTPVDWKRPSMVKKKKKKVKRDGFFFVFYSKQKTVSSGMSSCAFTLIFMLRYVFVLQVCTPCTWFKYIREYSAQWSTVVPLSPLNNVARHYLNRQQPLAEAFYCFLSLAL